MNAELKLRKARIQLIKRQPFFGTLALHLELVKTNSIPSTAVDGKNNLLYNEDFINKIQLEPCIGVVAHEVMHLALDVFGRRKGRD
ncbi:MAG TPA: hypothetical protein VJ044_20430, partial [Candidatus Hodarchaeales archaeon]|nr:hypothetical protein [Candidatus Hodarchaeales archaeon]